MPTIEGTFPKLGGDPLYASEVNSFASAGRFIKGGSIAIPSGTDTRITGSVLIPTGSLSNPASINIDWRNFQSDGTGSVFPYWEISGLSTNSAINFQSLYDTSEKTGEIKYIVGSPFLGRALGLLYLQGKPTPIN